MCLSIRILFMRLVLWKKVFDFVYKKDKRREKQNRLSIIFQIYIYWMKYWPGQDGKNECLRLTQTYYKNPGCIHLKNVSQAWKVFSWSEFSISRSKKSLRVSVLFHSTILKLTDTLTFRSDSSPFPCSKLITHIYCFPVGWSLVVLLAVMSSHPLSFVAKHKTQHLDPFPSRQVPRDVRVSIFLDI